MTTQTHPGTAPPPPPAAAEVFGERLTVLERFAALLAGAGVERGLIGPREAPRLWERHLLNCAGLSGLLDEQETVLDLGSGAGLPGLVLAAARPDLRLVLCEPLLRRATFLSEAVEELQLANVVVRRARAEELAAEAPTVDVVTARAVAPLERLAGWALPLLRPGGRLLALKGDRAAEELTAAEPALRAWAPMPAQIVGVGQERLGTAARVVVVTKGQGPVPRAPGASSSRTTARRRGR